MTNSTIRVPKRAAPPFRFAAVLVLVLSLLGVAPAGLTYAAQVTSALTTVDPGCPEATAAGQVVYGCTDLSRNLQSARLWLRQNRPPGTTDKLFLNANRSNYAIALLDDGKYIIGYSDNAKHAEIRLLEQMRGQSQRVVFDPATGRVSYQPARSGGITEVFTELEPCNFKCNKPLTDAGLRSKTTWSWPWNGPEGASKQEVKELRDLSNNSKSGLKQVALKQLFANGAPGRIDDPKGISSGARSAVGRQSGPGRPGGIDFSSIQLRYVSDGGTGGNTYSFRAPATPGKPSTDGTLAIFDAFESLNVWMTVEPSKFWVNLNPQEPDRIIDADLAQTDAGHVLLQSDLQLKESGTVLLNPNIPVGKEFWNRMNAAGLHKFCTRNWIVPKQATVRESGSELYILEAPLEVKAESEDFQLPGNSTDTCPPDSKPAEAIYDAVILPELTRLVNEAPEYTDLRRVFISRVAAEWYRQRMVAAGTAADYGLDSNDVDTLESVEPWNPRDIFDTYVKEINNTTYTTPDGYVVTTGGVDFTQPVKVEAVNETTFTQQYPALPTVVQKSLAEVAKTPDEKNAFAGGADQVPPVTRPPSSAPSATGSAGTGTGQGNGNGNQQNNGAGKTPTGSLPVTGVPIAKIVAIGVVLLIVGMLIMRFTGRRRRVPRE